MLATRKIMHYGDLLLRFSTPAILLVLIALLVRRKLYREFPLLFSYAIFSIIADISRQIASGHPVGYFIVYWSAEAIYGVLALLVLREAFHHVFSVEYRLLRWMRFVLPVTVMVILAFSIYEGMLSSAGYNKIRYVTEMIYWFDTGVHAFQGGLLLVLIVLSSVFPVRWLDYEVGIVIGLGINAIFTILADVLWFDFGNRFPMFLRYGPPAGYILATLIWLLAFSVPPKQTTKREYTDKEIAEIMREQWRTLAIIRKWLRRNRPFQLSH